MNHLIMNPRRAARLVARARRSLARGQRLSALLLVDRAIEYDQAGALDEDYAVLRAEIALSMGNEGPARALMYYNQGIDLTRAGRVAQAEDHYLEAHRVDPRFLWSLNNLAWHLSTSPMRRHWNGQRALDYAKVVCQQSFWSYWAYVGTLAAAYARCGMFNRAVRYQRRAIELAGPTASACATLEAQLIAFEAGQAYTAITDKVVAGEEEERPADGTVQ